MMCEEQHKETCLALRAICSSVESMLGPNKSLKCYISSQDDSAILGDTLQVLDALMSSYRAPAPPTSSSHLPLGSPPPSLQLLHEYCHEHRDRVGCGLTTLICLAGYWASEILTLIHQGLPLPVIFAVFWECLSKCKKLFENHSLELPTKTNSTPKQNNIHGKLSNSTTCSRSGVGKKQERVLSFSRHFQPKAGSRANDGQLCNGLGGFGEDGGVDLKRKNLEEVYEYISDRISRGREAAMKLALEATLLQQGHTLTSVKRRVPLQYYMVGKSEEQSRVVVGVVTSLHPDMVAVAQSNMTRKLRVVFLEGDCSPHSLHLGLQKRAGHVTSHDLSQLHERSTTSKWVEQMVAILTKFEIDVLLVGGTVSPLLWQQCVGLGVVVIKEMPADVRTAIVEMCGVTAVSYLTQCSTRSVGADVCLEVLESGWSKRKMLTVSSPDGTPISKTYCCRLYKDDCATPTTTVPPAVTTALLCGLTEYSTDNLSHQFTNCYHRLHWATKGLIRTHNVSTSEQLDSVRTNSHPLRTTSQLLPGGGWTEAACIRMLEESADVNCKENVSKLASSEGPEANLPLYFTSSWVSKSPLLKDWRICAYKSFAGGLRRYLTRCVINSDPERSQYEAVSVVEVMIRSGEPGPRGGGPKRRGEEMMDVAECKWLAWQKAVKLLEMMFFSTKVNLESIS